MPIVKVLNSTEKYQAIAKNLSHRNELSGRGDNIKETQTRVSFIKKNISSLNRKFCSFSDIGCGDGSFILALSKLSEINFGILPTEEEVDVVTNLLKANESSSKVSIQQGLSNNLPFSNNSIDLLLCNSVLHSVGFNMELVRKSISEFSRVQSKDSVLYIGEIPETNEMEGRNYGTSFLKYLVWVVNNRGLLTALKELVKYLRCFFSSNWLYTIQPCNIFFCEKINFINLLNSFGYEVVKIYSSHNNREDNESDEVGGGDWITSVLRNIRFKLVMILIKDFKNQLLNY